METQIKSPNECTPFELNTFEWLVKEGGEVMASGLRQRIKQAEKLVFVNDNRCIAVGAIKNPNADYKNNVFTKAGVPENGINYKYELGWLYVTPSARGKGYGRELMSVIAGFLNSSSCFATTRVNNDSMHYLFSKHSFSRLGTEYKSDNADYSLELYVYQP